VIEGLEEGFNPGPADLETGATWLHAAPYLLANGKSTRPEEDELQKLVDNGSITEQEKQALSNIDEPKEILGTIDEDLKEHQIEGAEGKWHSRSGKGAGAVVLPPSQKENPDQSLIQSNRNLLPSQSPSVEIAIGIRLKI